MCPDVSSNLMEGALILFTGNTNGDVSVWDMLQSSTLMTAEPVLLPYATFRAHNDCVNGVRYEPWVIYFMMCLM